MKSVMLAAAGLLCASAHAAVPTFNATCPGNIEVHADQGGPVYFNGKEGKFKRFNDNYYEATGAGITLSIAINPDGTPSLSYTGAKRAHGVCSLKTASGPADSSAPPSASAGTAPAWQDTPANRKAVDACSKALSRSVKVAQRDVTIKDVLWGEAGTGVEMTIPGVNTPWSCLYSRGKVQGLKARE